MISEDTVVRMYEEENKSTYEIANELNTYPNKIRRILIKRGKELKTRSEAQKTALEAGRIKHPTQGRTRSEKEKLKISASLSDYWKSMDEEEKQRRVQIAKDNWHEMSETHRARICQSATEGIRKAGKEGSKLERFILKKLTEAGYKVDFHKKNLIANEKLEIDLYIPELKTIIEIDGPSHFFPVWGEEKLQKQIKADLQKSGLILSKDYAIIRVKVLGFVSLKRQDDVAVEIINKLQEIKQKFPPRSQRYIEVEL
jgi:very-short-patch-repair endonuclease